MQLIRKEPIEKGWSEDKKFRVETDTGEQFLLRESSVAALAKKQEEFHMSGKVAALGIPMSAPVSLEVAGDVVRTFWTWIDGTDAEEVLASCTPSAQYAYGEEAGRILRCIHVFPAPPSQEPWDSRFSQKIDRKLLAYTHSPLQYPEEEGQAYIRFIAQNRHLLTARPQVYQHGDYHSGNMMIGTEGKLYIIDFNRNDYGDPWEEFNRIVWSAQCAPLFASGMVSGYFGASVPDAFWRLLALYIASNALSSIVWAIPYGETEVDTMRKQSRDILSWYDGMRRVVPSWFTPHP